MSVRGTLFRLGLEINVLGSSIILCWYAGTEVPRQCNCPCMIEQFGFDSYKGQACDLAFVRPWGKGCTRPTGHMHLL